MRNRRQYGPVSIVRTVSDPRYSFANERTFLAWVRTALGLIAGAAALEAIDTGWEDWVVTLLSAVLASTAGACSVLAWLRWRLAEAAIREGREVPPGYGHVVITAVLAGVSLAVLVLVLL
jgi:putative membrane protein